MNRPGVTTIISADSLEQRVTELSKEIDLWLKKEPVIAVCVLKSGFVFYSDLVRKIDSPIVCEFIAMQSHETLDTRTGEMQIVLDCRIDVSGKNVLLIDDLVGTGFTLSYLLRVFKGRQAKSVKTCALATKQKRSVIPLSIDFVGFTLEDKFYVGYGMDYCGWFRELPILGVPET